MARNKPKKLSDEDVQSYVQAVLDDAADFMVSTLQGPRELADAYYQGGTTLPFTTGRSQVIVDCVRSGVSSVLPSIARIFTQTDKLVEFWTDEPQEEKGCKEATTFCNHVYDKHDGYSALISMATDALKARIGVVKVWVEKKQVPRHSYMEANNAPFTASIEGEQPDAMSPPGVPAELIGMLGGPQGMPPGMPQMGQAMPPAPGPSQGMEDPEDMLEGDGTSPQLTEADENTNIYTDLVEKTIWHLDPVPPEEFLIDADAVSIYDAQVVAHRRTLTIGDMVGLGFEYEDVAPLASDGDDNGTMKIERNERRDYTVESSDAAQTIDPLSRPILVTEAYVWLDVDHDGVPELRRLICGGSRYEILTNEPVNYIPFAVGKCTIQPHVFAPISLAEDLIQDQDAQTAMLRSIIDNAALVNSPRTEVNERKVNLSDVKNGEIGAVIRVTEMGQINELTTPSTAAQTLPVLQYLQEVSEKRTGITKLSQGADADALQSTTKVAAAATVSASDARIEMMARNLGETGVKALFNTIMKVATYELDGPQTIKEAYGYTTVNPSAWADDMSIKVNVGLGSGRIDEKKMILQGLIQFQTAVLEKGGPNNPLCNWDNLRNSWAAMLRLSGIHNTSDYLPYVPKPVVAQVDQQQKQASQQSSDMQIQGAQQQLAIQKQQADAMQSMVQVEAQKASLKHQEQMASLQQKYESQLQQLQQELVKQQQTHMSDLRATIMEVNQKRDAAMLKFIADMTKTGVTREQQEIDAENAARMATQQTTESIQ